MREAGGTVAEGLVALYVDFLTDLPEHVGATECGVWRRSR